MPQYIVVYIEYMYSYILYVGKNFLNFFNFMISIPDYTSARPSLPVLVGMAMHERERIRL